MNSGAGTLEDLVKLSLYIQQIRNGIVLRLSDIDLLVIVAAKVTQRVRFEGTLDIKG